MPIIATIISLIYPFMAIPFLLIGISWDKKNIKKYSFAFALFFAMFGYVLYPKDIVDLTRYFKQVQLLYTSSFVEILKMDGDFLYVRDILFKLVAMTNDVHILPFIVGLFEYWMVFYVLFDAVERNRNHIDNLELFFLILIIIGVVSPDHIIGNTRCVFAYTIVSFAYYKLMVQGKRNIIIFSLFIVAACIHGASIALIFVAVISTLMKKIRKSYIILSALVPTAITILYDFSNIFLKQLSFFKPIVLMINRAYRYLNWNESSWDAVYGGKFDFLNRIYGTFFIVMLFLLCIFDYGKNCNSRRTNSNVVKYLNLVGFLAIGSLSFVLGVFWRFEAIVVLFSPVIFLNIECKHNMWQDVIKKIIYLSAIGMTILSFIHQNSNYYLLDMFYSFLNNSPIEIIIRGLLQIFVR